MRKNNAIKNYAIMEAGFRTGLVYRLHYLASVLQVPISLLIYYYLWKSIFAYSSVTVIKGFTLNDLISYYALVMIVGYFTFSECDKWMEEDVVQGDTLIVMLKPFNLMSWYFFFELGLTGLGVFLHTVPVFIIAIFFGLKGTTALYAAFFALAVLLGMMLYFLITFIIGLSAFWLFRISGLRRVKRVVLAFLGGSMLPLTFFPQNVQNVFLFLPFQYLRFIPVNIYLQKYTISHTMLLLGIALAWALLLYLFAVFVQHRAALRFTGAGT